MNLEEVFSCGIYDRLWYIQNFLIPSIVNQGIENDIISISLDTDSYGCLESCMKDINIPRYGNTWHLQNDIIICSDFKKSKEINYSKDIVCRYCYEQDSKKLYIGKVLQKQMWYSFL